MKRLAILCLLLAGCRSFPLAPELPTYNVQRGPVEGEPGAPSVRRFTAVIDGDSLRISAVLVPPAELPSLADWGWQMWIGSKQVGPHDLHHSEYIIVAQEIENVGPLVRSIRSMATNRLLGQAKLRIANPRRLEVVVPRYLDNQSIAPSGTCAVWMQFTTQGALTEIVYARAHRTSSTIVFTE